MDFEADIDDAFWVMAFGFVWGLITLLLKWCSRNTNLRDEQPRFANPELALISLPPPLYDQRRAAEIAAACTGCVICLGEYGSDDEGVSCRTLKPCGHRFHEACIAAWLDKERRCPICRGPSWEIAHKDIPEHQKICNVPPPQTLQMAQYQQATQFKMQLGHIQHPWGNLVVALGLNCLYNHLLLPNLLSHLLGCLVVHCRDHCCLYNHRKELLCSSRIRQLLRELEDFLIWREY